MAINYSQLMTDLSVALSSLSSIKRAFVEGEVAEVEIISNMPLANIRLGESAIDSIYSNVGYSEQASLFVDAVVFDYTSSEEAVSLRSDVVIAIKNYLISNPRFSNEIMSSRINSISFSTPYQDEKAFIAIATLNLICYGYGE